MESSRLHQVCVLQGEEGSIRLLRSIYPSQTHIPMPLVFELSRVKKPTDGAEPIPESFALECVYTAVLRQ
jgi:hypothetical protein